MAATSKSAELRFILNNQDVLAPEGWQDIGVSAVFSEEDTQASITTDSLIFSSNGRQFIKDHIDQGLSNGVGIFEGIPLDIQAFNNVSNQYIFSGHIATYEGIEDQTERDRVSVQIVQNDSKTNIQNLIEGVSFGYLLEQNIITSADYIDVDYDIVPLNETTDIITLAIAVYLLQKALTEQIEKLANDIAVIASYSAVPPSGSLGGLVYRIATAVIRAIYAAVILKALINLAADLMDAYLPIIRQHKAMSYERLLLKVCEFLGIEFNTSIEDLDSIVYLPSNPNADSLNKKGFIDTPGSIKVGIPNVSDYGYLVTEFFQICRDVFNARFSVINGVLELHSLNSDYWQKQSTYIMPDVRSDAETTRYNTNEFAANIFLAFDTDLLDEYTITNFTGTNYEVITTPKNVTNKRNTSNKGLVSFRFPVCLGNRKAKLSALESALASVASILDDAIKAFGGSSNYESRVKSRTGIMKVSNNNHSKPKILYVQNGRIPSNERDLISAKTLYDKYHNYYSFIANNFKKQRIVYNSVVIPFGLDDFNKMVNNSYFTTNEGEEGKVTELNWIMGSDKATVNYYVSSPYTFNLQDIKIEG